MADYYSILTKTIEGLPSNTAETRSMVYAKARTAIDKQLRTREPTPSEEVIGRQLEMLEEAIEKVEANASIDQAISELNNAEEVAAEEVSESELDKVTAATEPAADESLLEDTGSTDVEPSQSPDTKTATTSLLEPAPIPDAPPVTTEIPEAAVVETPPERDQPTDPPRKNVVLRIIPYLVALIVVAGGAYALWMNQSTLITAFNDTLNLGASESDGPEPVSSDSEPEAPESPVRVVTPENEDAQPRKKDNVRLSETGESVVVEPVEPDPVTEPVQADETPVILDEDVAQTQEPEPEEQVAVSEVQNDGTQPDTESQTTPVAVGQSAFLYEEGASGSGAARIPANVVWSLVNEPPSDGLPAEAVIKGKLTVPDRGLTMDLSLKRNTDAGLPASHIIELIFEAPSDFSGGQIDNVARFVLKATEQARGDGLVAVPAKISNGYFLIALNNLPQAVETNTKLLTESDWIDIPMGYTTGRRALVTLEKGAVGDKVFKDAFADWKNR